MHNIINSTKCTSIVLLIADVLLIAQNILRCTLITTFILLGAIYIVSAVSSKKWDCGGMLTPCFSCWENNEISFRNYTSFCRWEDSARRLIEIQTHRPVLEITVGHRTLSDQILKMTGQFHIMIGHDDRTSHQHILSYLLQGVVSQ